MVHSSRSFLCGGCVKVQQDSQSNMPTEEFETVLKTTTAPLTPAPTTSGTQASTIGIDLIKLAEQQQQNRAEGVKQHMKKVPTPVNSNLLNTLHQEAKDGSRIRWVILPAVQKGAKIVEISELGVYDETLKESMPVSSK